MAALDQIKRALVLHLPALYTAGQTKPKLVRHPRWPRACALTKPLLVRAQQQALQRLISVFLCELPTEL